MADPKYAGLPGIAYDEPDVFESGDLPECDRDYSTTDCIETNDSVEMLHLSPEEAHAHFRGRVVDSSRVDFSDRITGSRRRGYDARRVEWEVNGIGEAETLTQKYQRLKCEVDQLVNEIQNAKDPLPCGDGVVNVADFSLAANELQKKIINLQLDDFHGGIGGGVLGSSLSGILEVKKIKGESTDKITIKREPGLEEKAKDSMCELYFAPEKARLEKLAQGADLDRRIEALETLIGSSTDKLSSLSAWTNHRSITGAVAALSSRMALLEPSHLDHVEGRLHAIHTRMNAIAERKGTVEEAEKQSKVSELYELTKKTETLCTAVPEIVERLIALEGLHDQAVQFSHTLQQLDAGQTQLSSVLIGNDEHLQLAQQKFHENSEMILKKVTDLEQRLQKLKK